MLTAKEKIVLDRLISFHYQNDDIDLFPSDNIEGIKGNELELIFKSLHQKGYIELKKYTDGEFNISLTYSGLSYKESEMLSSQKDASVINNFNAPINNSAIGTTGNVTINLNSSYDEARSIISSHDMSSCDKELALKLIDYIETLTDNDASMKKGCLSKFSDLISKHSWIPSLIGNALIKYFIGQ